MLCLEVYRPIEITIDEPTELYAEEANFFDMPPKELNSLDLNL